MLSTLFINWSVFTVKQFAQPFDTIKTKHNPSAKHEWTKVLVSEMCRCQRKRKLMTLAERANTRRTNPNRQKMKVAQVRASVRIFNSLQLRHHPVGAARPPWWYGQGDYVIECFRTFIVLPLVFFSCFSFMWADCSSFHCAFLLLQTTTRKLGSILVHVMVCFARKDIKQ